MTATKTTDRAIADALILVRVGGDLLTPELRPALVVRRWPGVDAVNAVVFLDERDPPTVLAGEVGRVGPWVRRCQSLSHGDGMGQWRTCGESAAVETKAPAAIAPPGTTAPPSGAVGGE